MGSSNDKNWSSQAKGSHWDLRGQKFPDPDDRYDSDGECAVGFDEYNACVCAECEVREDITITYAYLG